MIAQAHCIASASRGKHLRRESIAIGLFLVLCLPASGRAADDARLLPLLREQPKVTSVGRAGGGSQLQVFSGEDASSPTFGTQLCVVSLSGPQARMKVKLVRRSANKVAIYESLVSGGALVGMTGGFFATDNAGMPMPFGLVKAGGKVTSARNGWTGGGFLMMKNSRLQIVPAKMSDATRAASDAVQSKPVLIERGRNGIHSLSGGPADRSAVGIDGAGHVMLFVLHKRTADAANLPEFSALLLDYVSIWKTKVVDAIAMDGGPAAHLYVPGAKTHCGTEAETFVPNILTFGER